MAAAISTNQIERRELVNLVFCDRSIFGPDRIPFAFLLTSPEEVVVIRVRDASERIGLSAEASQSVDETLEMLVHALISDDRPDSSDADILLSLTSSYSDVGVSAASEHHLTDAENTQLQMNEGVRLVRSFEECMARRIERIEALDEQLSVEVFRKAAYVA